MQLFRLLCVLVHHVIGAKDEIAQFVVRMGLDEGIAALPDLLVDLFRLVVFLHPIVVDVSLGGEVEAFVSDDGEKPLPGANGIDDALIKYLEELSRLTLTEDEEKKAKEDLTKILDYIDTLNSLDTDNVEPMSHPFPYTNNFREDEVKPSEERELILKNAPQQKDGCFKVPTTVE